MSHPASPISTPSHGSCIAIQPPRHRSSHDKAFSVNEQCVPHGECDVFQDFINVGKPVFHIEYPTEKTSFSKLCTGSQFTTMLKNMDLSGMATYCDGSEATTQTL
ncbi:hypothetical protein CcaverHIS002_0500650 [Cutaneotrichosporon cavernicola]|nr:hypothetical protein CcaverHIS002_0500650 [Cutaneotrichosporon cavernicola]